MRVTILLIYSHRRFGKTSLINFIFRLIHAVFLKGLPQGDEVFGRHIGLDIVNGVEYVAAAGRQSFDIVSDVVIDCLGCATGQNAKYPVACLKPIPDYIFRALFLNSNFCILPVDVLGNSQNMIFFGLFFIFVISFHDGVSANHDFTHGFAICRYRFQS